MDTKKLIESLSPNEKKVLPHLGDKINEICKKSNLDKTSVVRSLEYLQNKNIIKLTYTKKKIIELDVNGALYLKKGLPERRLLHLLTEKHIVPLQEAQKESGLTEDEFKASLGALKKRALIELKNEKIMLNANREEISKKTLEEQFLESLPTDYDSLTPEQQFALKILQNRRQIIEIKEDKKIEIEITPLGKEILKSKLNSQELIEKIDSEMLKKESNWKGKKFRRYDVTSPVPEIYGGKRHFVNQSVDYARKIWTEMGFKEMSGEMIQSSFWNFDALFTAQDHPVREMHDTFFIDKKIELPDKHITSKVKEAHEKGINGSKGWQYEWNEEEAKKAVLRTHTTCLSVKTLANLKKEEIPAKFFAIGKCFRNETVDINHLFELTQTEGIIVDENANLRQLIGLLIQFYKKMGYEKIRIRPSYFPYTEPSLEVDVYDEKQKSWLELGGAGIFRPEVTTALLGKPIPVLAWGQGFERIIKKFYGFEDLRKMYKNDLRNIRETKFWI